MKKLLIILLSFLAYTSHAQAEFPESVQLTNVISTTAPFVNVQSSTGVVNKINKSDLVDAIIVNTTAELTPAIGNVNKLYATRDNTLMYRYNGTIYVPIGGGDVSGKEDIANKSSSFTASSTVTYANTKALVDGLATKVSTVGTTGNIQRIVGTNQLGNSALVDNGTSVTSSLPFLSTGSITGNSFVKAAASTTNILLAGGADITQTSLPISTATQSALDLKANLAGTQTFTGVHNFPTATTGTNTTQVATTAFVQGSFVNLTGSQSISGLKSFNNGISLSSSLSAIIMPTNNTLFIGATDNVIGRVSDKVGIKGDVNKNFIPALLSTSLISLSSKTFDFPNQDGTIALTSNPSSITATSFINSTAPATNVLLAGGGTLAQTGLPYLPLAGGTLTGALNGTSASFTGTSGTNLTLTNSLDNSNIVFNNFNAGAFPQGQIKLMDDGAFGGIFIFSTKLSGAAGNALVERFRIGNTGAATFSSTVTSSLLKTTVYTVATLPTPPSTGTGTYATVSDAVAPAYLTPVMGGGAVVTPVFYNGSNWICH